LQHHHEYHQECAVCLELNSVLEQPRIHSGHVSNIGQTPLTINFQNLYFCSAGNTRRAEIATLNSKFVQGRSHFQLSALPKSPNLLHAEDVLLQQPLQNTQPAQPTTIFTPPTVYRMADKSTPKPMGGLTSREQDILVAALSKCIKSGDIQVSPVDLPHSHSCSNMSSHSFFVSSNSIPSKTPCSTWLACLLVVSSFTYRRHALFDPVRRAPTPIMSPRFN
jgi:hypothetical protein